MMNNGGNGGGNTASYNNLQEIWPFAVNLGGASAAAAYQLGESVFVSATAGSRDEGNGIIPMVLPRDKKRRELVVGEEFSKSVSSSGGGGNGNGNGLLHESDSKRLKTLGSEDADAEIRVETEANPGKPAESNIKPPEPPKQDYIHVRARRGQATDSHSLAERARREKISERMKILQDLVPGCNKVIGKALVLDEIINYIQSLQRQVEFLSMKLEAVTARTTPSNEAFPPKDFGQQAFDMSGMAFSSQPTREYRRGSSPEWLHMQIGSGFERTT